jgi:phage shock protein PspC (stress-responsive transcriptional regulator)
MAKISQFRDLACAVQRMEHVRADVEIGSVSPTTGVSSMQTYQPSLFARHDTLLGICQAIGEDLGFNPTWLRVGFATMVFFNLGAAVAVYLAAGAVVLATRLIHRSPRKAMFLVEAQPAPVTDAAQPAEPEEAPVLLAAA